MSNVCPYCEVGSLEEVLFSGRVKAGRKIIEVAGLVRLVCSECGNASVPLDMHAKNAALLDHAAAYSRGSVSRGTLRKLREVWGVTQKEASRIFGAGESAFAKWESGQANLSTPSALLVQCAVKFPPVLAYLSRLANVVPKAEPVSTGSEWHSVYRAAERGACNDSGVRLFLIAADGPSHMKPAKTAVSEDLWSEGLRVTAANGAYVAMPEAA
jgi:HTH-type transcriptional regulator/antitoxin MqsA